MLGIYTEELEKYIEELEARLEEYENPNNAISDDLDHNKWLENEAEALRQEIENLRASEQEIRDIFAEIEKYNRKIEDYTKRMENAPTEHLKNGYGQLIEDFKKYQKELLNRINGKMPESVMAAINERLEGNKEDKNEKEIDENKVEEDRKEESKEEVKEESERERLKRSIEEKAKRKKEIEDRLKELGVEVKEPKEEEVKIEKQPRPIKVTPEQNKNIETNEKKVRKSVYAILDSVIRDEDGKPFDLTAFQANRVEGSRIKVTKAMRQNYSHKNRIYNFFGKTAWPLMAGLLKLKNLVEKAYTHFHPKQKKAYEQIEKNLDKLPDEEIEVLHNELSGTNANSMRSYEAIMPLVMKKIRERRDEKINMPLRLEITAIQTDIMERYDKIGDLKEKLETTKDLNERAKIQAEITELSKDAVQKINYFKKIWNELDDNLNGKGAHGLDEVGKAIKSHQNRRGKIFGHNMNIKDGAEFSAKTAEMDEKLRQALESGNNLEALEAFGDFEMYKYENTKAHKGLSGELEDGAFMWKPMPETLDYNPDPLMRYITTTIAEAAIISGIIGNVKNYLAEQRAKEMAAQEQQRLDAMDQKNMSASQHNQGVEHQINQYGKDLEGQAGDYGKGIRSIAREDNGFRRATDEYGQYFDPKLSSKQYHHLDDISHNQVDQMSKYITNQSHGLSSIKTSNPLGYVTGMKNMWSHVHSDAIKALTKDIGHIKNYLQENGNYSYEGILKSLHDIVNHTGNYEKMIDGMIASVKTGQALQQIDVLSYEPVQAMVANIPFEVQPIITPIIATALQASVQSKLAENAIEGSFACGKSIEDTMEKISNKRNGIKNKEEMEEMFDEDDEKTDDYEHQAAM